MKRHHSPSAFALLCALLSSVPLGAQTAAPAAAPAAPNADQVVTLEPFSVNSTADRGYVASETMSGSRVATLIQDLPFQIEVVPSELMKDFGDFEGTNSTFGYTSGITAIDLTGTGNSVIRGFSSQYMLRDGFFRLGRTDPVLLDRVEVLKGPSVASIYGETQPGGIINMVSKRPTDAPHLDLDLMVGSYDNDREDLTLSGPTGVAGINYLLVASDFERDYSVRGSTLRNRTLGIGLEKKWANGGDLNFLTTTWRGQGDSALTAVPFFYNSLTKTYTGIDQKLSLVNQVGPDSTVTREASDATITYDQPLNSVFSLRMAANWWHSNKWVYNAASGQEFDYINDQLFKGTPAYDPIHEDGGGFQADLVSHEKLFGGVADNQTLLTFDFSDYYRFESDMTLNSNLQYANTPTSAPPGAAGTYWAKYIFPGESPLDYSIPQYTTNNFGYASGKYNRNRASIWGGLLRDQLRLFNDRLLLFGTLRHDDVVFNLDAPFEAAIPNSGVVAHGSSSAWSPSWGAVYKVTPGLSVYASRSVGFNANAQNQSAVNSPAIQPNQRSLGYDYGLKGDLIGDRLFFTLGGWYTVLNNVADTQVNAQTGVAVTAFSESELSRGADLDLTWRATDQLTFVADYSQTYCIVTAAGRDTTAVGFAPQYVPPNQGGLAAKYVFGGVLKGFSVNGGIQYVDKAPATSPLTGDLYNGAGVNTGNNGERYLLLPSYYLVDADLHYQWGGKIKQTVSVFLKNLADKSYIAYYESTLTQADGRGVYVQYSIGY